MCAKDQNRCKRQERDKKKRETERDKDDKEEVKKVAGRSWSREGVRFPLESDVPNPSGSTYR